MIETKQKVKNATVDNSFELVSSRQHSARGCPMRFISILIFGVSILTSVPCSSELPPKPPDKDDLKTVASGVGKTERVFANR